MSKCYRVVFQTFEQSNPTKVLNEKQIISAEINLPTNCLDFTMGMDVQLQAIKKIQDHVLQEKLKLLEVTQIRTCPKCEHKLVKYGNQISPFHDVFTDHNISFQRRKCLKCGYETPSTAKMLFGTVQSAELQKIQVELGANYSYRQSQGLLAMFSAANRPINNHDRIKQVTESVGSVLEKTSDLEIEVASVAEAKELVLNIDGGHIKTTDKNARSIEAMTSVIYQPEAIQSNDKNTRNYLTSKHCAASVRDDGQQQIISGTIVAALKQGLGENTHVTALCDGAQNCWNVVEALRPLCGSMTCILDWFHLAMKLQNISLPKKRKEKLLRIKWHLWRGNVDKDLVRLDQLIEQAGSKKEIDKITKFQTYISNNRLKIIDYRRRQKEGLVFTSNLAESTVESLINQRCKGQQHMRWSRKGLNPLLQIRAALKSKGEWENKWQTAILNAI